MKKKIKRNPAVSTWLVLLLLLPLLASCSANQNAAQTTQTAEQVAAQCPYAVTATPAAGWHIDEIDGSSTNLLSLYKDQGAGTFGVYYRQGGSQTVEEQVAFLREDVPRREGGVCRDTQQVTVDGYQAQEVTYTQLTRGIEEMCSSTFLSVDGVILEIACFMPGRDDFEKSEPDFRAMRDSIKITKR